MTPAVDVKDLVVRYASNGRPAVDGISLCARPGELVGLLGPNGSGKSTLFKVLATLLAPTAGTALLGGCDVARDRLAVRRQLGVVFQSPSLDKELTALENLVHHGEMFGLRGGALRERAGAMLEAVGLADRGSEIAKRLSGGMRRRLEIAKCLLPEPAVLLMDEPTVGLDPAARRQVWELVARLRHDRPADRPLTVLVTTHLMDEAAGCGRLYLLDAGKVVAEGTPAELVAGVGGDVVTLVPEVQADASPEDAARRLAAAVVERLGGPAEAFGGVVRVERADGHEVVARVLQDRASWPVPVREATVGRPTLEDVFIRLTGRSLAAT